MLVKGREKEKRKHHIQYIIFVFLSLSMKECSRGVAGKKKRMEEAHNQTIKLNSGPFHI